MQIYYQPFPQYITSRIFGFHRTAAIRLSSSILIFLLTYYVEFVYIFTYLNKIYSQLYLHALFDLILRFPSIKISLISS